MQIYLDHQASTPLSQAAMEAMRSYLTETYANPHSDDHAAGWAAAEAVETARHAVAAAVHADVAEIVFTSGATEANNLALLGVAEAFPGPHRIVVSAIDHKSVLAPARALARRGFELVVLPVDGQGFVDLDQLDLALREPTTLVSIGAVNSEIGTMQPMARIAATCRQRGALLHSDATQALAWNEVDVDAWGVDFASVSSHKVGGPKGVGALYVALHARDRIGPIQLGGDQEGGLRPGTVPTPLCAAFAAACSALPDAQGVERWRRTTQRLLRGMRDIWSDLHLNGAPHPRHPGNLNVAIPDIEADRLLALVQPDLAISRGSACTSGTPEPSHVLFAMGLAQDRMARSVRLSTGPATTEREVDLAVEMLARVAVMT